MLRSGFGRYVQGIMRRPIAQALCVLVVGCLCLIAANSCFGQEINWIVPGGTPADWHDPANWAYSHEGTTPEEFWTFRIDIDGIVNLDSGTAHGSGGTIGDVGTGHLRQWGGSLDLFGNSFPAVVLGYLPGSLGIYELTGGNAKVFDMAVGFLGRGELRVSDGFFDFDRILSIGDSTDADGLVVQTGGIVGRTEPNLRNEIKIGSNSFGMGRYELSGGQVVTTNLVVDAGSFQQDGGTLTVQEVLLVRGGLANKQAEFRISSGDAIVNTRGLSIRSIETGPRSQFWHDDGTVTSLFTAVGNGSYDMANGQLFAESLAVGADAIGGFDSPTSEGRFIQSGGTVTTGSLSIRGARSFDGSRTATGRYELRGGTVFADRLVLGGEEDSEFVQTGGRLFVNTLELSGYRPTNGHAVFKMSNGRTIINDSLTVAAGPDFTGEFDLQNQDVVLQTGLGSNVYFGEGTVIRNGEAASFIIGSDSLLGVAENLDVNDLLGSVQHHDVVVYVPGQTIHVKPGQRAQVGTDGNWRAGAQIDGFAYDSPARGVARIEGNLIVGASGHIQLNDDRSHVIINGHQNAGVFGGITQLAQLTVRGTQGNSHFAVREGGSLTVTELLRINEDQSFELVDGQVHATRVEIGDGGKYSQSGGTTVADRFEITLSGNSAPSGRGRGELSGGNLTADYFLVTASGSFIQSGGSVDAGEVAAQSYRMTGGDLTVRSSLNNHFGDGRIDLTGAQVTINVAGGIVDLGPANIFVQSQNATLNVDEHSLVIVPAGYNLASRFATFNNAGILQDVSQPLVIPADREIHGAGNLTSLPSVEIRGKLIGEAAVNGLSLTRFQVFPGAEVNLPSGYLSSQRTTGSSVTGGIVRAATLTIETDSTFVQSGGEVTVDIITNRDRSTYQLIGGTLTVRDEWSSGQLDFGETASTLVLGENAYLNLDRLAVLESQQASLIGERNSLIITNSDNLPANLFANFSTDGLVHVVGQPLTVPADRRLTGTVNLIGGVINDGRVAPGRDIGQLQVSAGDYTQSATGVLELTLAGHDEGASSGGTFADFLQVEGTANLDGKLEVQINDDFTPTVGDAYLLLRANQVVGQFADVSFPEIIAGLKWKLDYQSDRVTLSVAARLPLDDISVGDFDQDGELGASDIDALTAQIISGEYRPMFDVNGDSYLNDEDRRFWIEEQSRVLYGDANFDGEFTSSDLVTVFVAGQYEDDLATNSTWESGDWDGNGEFATGDLVVAFVSGHYEESSAGAVRAVPEPNSFAIVMASILCAAMELRRRCKS